MSKKWIFLVVILNLLTASPLVHAACTSPPGSDESFEWDEATHTWTYCDGTTWKNLREVDDSGSGAKTRLQIANDTGSCTAAKLGRLRYDGASTWEYCDGTTWQTLASAGSTSAAGNSGEIQFNSGGVLGASSNYFWDNTNVRLGIGTNTPEDILHIEGTDHDITHRGTSNSSQHAAADYMFKRSRAGGGVGEGDKLGGVRFYGRKGGVDELGAQIYAYVDETPASDDMPTRLEFATTPDGSDTPVNRMVIKNDGKIGVGTTTPESTLHVPDGKYFQAEDNNAGAPPSADCDTDAERGRQSIDTTNNLLYVCNGATRGWDYVALSD